jgi:hypothetical protein
MADDLSRLKGLAISESGLVFDPTNGAIYTSNQVGLSMIAALREGLDSGQIGQRIAAEYDVEADTAERDLFDFCGQLLAYEVIRNV